MGLLIQIVLIFAIVYFLLIRPQRQQQKKHQEMVASLARGDEVVTTGGLIGEIVQLKDDRLMLKTGDVRVVVERGKVARKMGVPDTNGK